MTKWEHMEREREKVALQLYKELDETNGKLANLGAVLSHQLAQHHLKVGRIDDAVSEHLNEAKFLIRANQHKKAQKVYWKAIEALNIPVSKTERGKQVLKWIQEEMRWLTRKDTVPFRLIQCPPPK